MRQVDIYAGNYFLPVYFLRKCRNLTEKSGTVVRPASFRIVDFPGATEPFWTKISIFACVNFRGYVVVF